MFKHKKLFFILLFSFILFGFSNASTAYSRVKFKKYIPHKCFDSILIPFSEIDSSLDDVYVECRCHINRPKHPPLPIYDKIYHPNSNGEHHHLFFTLWKNYVEKYGGNFVFFRYEYDSRKEEFIWKRQYFRWQHKINPCARTLMYYQKKFKELADKKNMDD